MDNSFCHWAQDAAFIARLQKALPELAIVRHDERFTSKMAFQSMLDGGLKKEQRKNKA